MTQVTNIAICVVVLLVLVLVWMVAKKLAFFIMTAFFAFAMYNNTQTLRALQELGLRLGQVDKGQLQDSRAMGATAPHPVQPHGHPKSHGTTYRQPLATATAMASAATVAVPTSRDAAADAGPL